MLGRGGRQEGTLGDARVPGEAAPPRPSGATWAPDRQISATQAQWLEWGRQQTEAFAAAEMKAAAARDPSAGPRGSARDSTPLPTTCASTAPADAPAGKGAPPLLFEDRFADRAALPKGVTFAPTEVPTVGSDGGTPRGFGPLDADAEMRDGEPDTEVCRQPVQR